MKKKKIIYVVLTLLLSLSIIPTSALARLGTKARDFVEVIDRVKASVVQVRVEKTFVHPKKPGAPEGEIPVKVTGAGLVIQEEGYILTCEHLLEEAKKIEVVDVAGKSYKTGIVGRDALTDIAVLKVTVDSRKMTPAVLGNSNQVKPGEWVIALGYPEDLQETVTVGVVSGRSEDPKGVEYIQTDALIRPGNSGGPLLTEEGRVIGITSSTAGGFGRSIPINLAISIANQLIKHGEVLRGYLGVIGQDITEELAAAFGVKTTSGVLIGDIEHYSPAEKYNLLVGDVILKFDGQDVKNTKELTRLEAETTPNKMVDIEIIRDRERKTVPVRFGQAMTETSQRDEIDKQFGLSVEDISEDWKKKIKTERADGVVVSRVRAASAASAADLMWGDIIVEADGEKVRNRRDFYQIIEGLAKKENILMLIERAGKTSYVVLRVD
ncbi:MAG: trypsin-like peptidase domain-containing protein [Thermodesulfobacteriota bacterium]